MATVSETSTSDDTTSNVDSDVVSHKMIESRVLEHTVRCTWKMRNADIFRQSTEFIKSQNKTFEIGNSIGLPTTWVFYLSPESDEWIGCFFQLVEAPTHSKEVNVSFTVKIKKANGGSILFGKHGRLFNMIEHATPVVKYLTLGFSKVLNRTAKVDELPLVDGALTIEFEFTLYAIEKNELEKTVEDKVKDFEMLFLRQLSDDLDNLCDLDLASSADCDTKIISSDGVEFRVNREFLSARSNVFKIMFQTKMEESETGIIYLDDLSSKVVTVLLKYINAAKLHEDWQDDDVIEGFIYAAHKYEQQLLLKFLDLVLINICTIGNAKRLGVLAKRMELKKAENDLFHFIKKNATDLSDITLFVDGRL